MTPENVATAARPHRNLTPFAATIGYIARYRLNPPGRLAMYKALIIGALALSLAVPAAPAFAQDDEARQCANIFNFLPRIIRREAVAAIGPDTRVVIHPICTDLQMITFGNAAGLSKTIAANPTLTEALARKRWRPDDVTAMNIHNGVVDLYVHHGS